MERQRPEYLPAQRSEGIGILWTVLIGTGLAVAMGGAVMIYLETAEAWHRNQAERTKATEAQRAAGNAATATQARMAAMYAQQREVARAEARKQAEQEAMDNKDMRCINGTLFKRLPNGWENVPGRSCN